MTFYTYVEHSTTKTTDIKYYMKKQHMLTVTLQWIQMVSLSPIF